MPARSADLAFGNIARQLGFVAKERLREAFPQALARGVSLEQFLVESGDLSPAQWGQVIQIRLRFGRKCLQCGQITYLMGSVPPCEHCGGTLQLQPGDEAPGARGQSGTPSERVAAVPPTRPVAPPQRPPAPHPRPPA
ncbi:MAG: hypothetical protein D6731_10000, partial [Planctomycetota bacterium]